MTAEAQNQSGGSPWSIGYGYNANGHLASLVYPAGLTVTYAPNALGQPTQAGTFATGVSYFPNGAIKQFTYGNGVIHTMTQNARQLPARSTSNGEVLDMGYTYDRNGNVTAITDYTTGARQTRGMSYDMVNRLTQATSSMFGTASYTYDALDNLTSVKVTGGPQVRDHTYIYTNNRLTNVTNTVGGASVIGLGYDPRGNLSNRNGQLYDFDFGNRLRSGQSGMETYRYDAHGRRILSAYGGSIFSMYSKDGQLLWQRDERNNQRLQNIYLGGSLIATRMRPTGGETETITYHHTDALGSPIATTNLSKVVVQASEYEPYGKLLNRSNDNRPGYTGHVMDAATGMTYMQQRYYDPQIGMFLSVDPVTSRSKNGVSFHRYRYANSNPYKFIDPDGRWGSSWVFDKLEFISEAPPPPPENDTSVTTMETVAVTAPRPMTTPRPSTIPWGAIGGAVVRSISLPLTVVGGFWPTTLNAPACEMPGGPPCGMMSVKPNREQKPPNVPAGTRPIDQYPGLTTDDIHRIKRGIRAGPADWVGISPDGHVWVNEDGEASDQGHHGEYRP